jgi:2-dehydropantoate 2-reductase
MKICIFGAGAIGGYMGVKLAQAGADVSLVARGPHLAAMRGKGLTLIDEGGTVTVPVTASEDPAELGVQDYVIVTLKAHSVPPVVGQDAAADRAGDDGRLGRERGAVVVFPQDRRAAGGNAAGKRRSGKRAMGRVRPRPGAGLRGLSGGGGVGARGIRHIEGNRFSLGEPDGSKSDRAVALSQALSAAGLKAPVRPRSATRSG